MKLSIALLVLAMIAGSAMAYHQFVEPNYFRNSDDVFEYVSTANHQIYVFLVYNRVWAAEEYQHPLKARYDLEREDLKQIIGKYGRDVHFSEIDVTQGDFTHMLQEVGVNTSDLDTYPIAVVIDDGHGIWVQGPREFSRVSRIIDEFVKDPESHWY